MLEEKLYFYQSKLKTSQRNSVEVFLCETEHL